jgi:hypothetical protein
MVLNLSVDDILQLGLDAVGFDDRRKQPRKDESNTTRFRAFVGPILRTSTLESTTIPTPFTF